MPDESRIPEIGSFGLMTEIPKESKRGYKVAEEGVPERALLYSTANYRGFMLLRGNRKPSNR